MSKLSHSRGVLERNSLTAFMSLTLDGRREASYVGGIMPLTTRFAQLSA